MKFIKDKLIFDDSNNLEFTGERYIPNETSNEMTIEHMQRYLFAKEFVKNKIILDAACGEGYGSHILSKEANKVFAIDLDEDVIGEAQRKYNKDNIHFCASSIEKLPFEDKIFDTIVSFETIEHVKEEIQQIFLKEVNRTLKDDGIFIISTPNKRVYTDKVGHKNIHHEKEFYKNEFSDFLSKYFKYTYIFNQHFRLGYFLQQEGKEGLINLELLDSEDARYYVVVCSNTKLEISNSNLYEVFSNSMYFELTQNCNKLDKEIGILNKDFKEFRENNKKYIYHLEQDIRKLKEVVDHRDKDIEQLKETVDYRDKDIEQLKEVMNHRDKDIEQLKEVIYHRDRDILDLNKAIEYERKENEKLKEVIKKPISIIIKKIFGQSKR